MKIYETGRRIVAAGLMLLAIASFSVTRTFSQTTIGNTAIDYEPKAPIVFQTFPISLLGIGDPNANLSAFQNFGLKLNNTGGTTAQFVLLVDAYSGQQKMFKSPSKTLLTVPVGSHFVGLSQLLAQSFSGGVSGKVVGGRTSLDDEFVKSLKGGLPSGQFEFRLFAGPAPVGAGATQFGTITAQVLAGTTVDLISPSDGLETSSLPQFQWSSASGINPTYKLFIAKIKGNQSREDALNNSSQRAVIEVTGMTSYQTTAGGPAGALENNLQWNPGLIPGDYCYQVILIQEDPISKGKSEVKSVIRSFTVGGGGGGIGEVSALNTQEIIGLLSDASGTNIGDKLKGFKAISITINDSPASVETLREKLQNLPKASKWEIKP